MRRRGGNNTTKSVENTNTGEAKGRRGEEKNFVLCEERRLNAKNKERERSGAQKGNKKEEKEENGQGNESIERDNAGLGTSTQCDYLGNRWII